MSTQSIAVRLIPRSIIALSVYACFAGLAMAGHGANECKEYAQNAVNQFRNLGAAGCMGKPGDSLWSDNYNGHYNWCMSNNADLGHEFKRRRLAIESCQRHSDSECHKYANNAVNQTKEAERKSCPGVVQPRWGENELAHYNWCKANPNADLGHEFKQRRLAIEKCSGNGNAGPALFSASVVLPASGQNAVHVSGSGFAAGTVRISYNWTQTSPTKKTTGYSHFDVGVQGGTISANGALSCPAGMKTSVYSVTAKELPNGRQVTAAGGGGGEC